MKQKIYNIITALAAIFLLGEEAREQYTPAEQTIPQAYTIAPELPTAAAQSINKERTASTSTIMCRIAHTREDTEVRADDRFITSSTGTPNWKPGEQVGEGSVRAYEGAQYECRQAHRSQPAWTPPAVLALWLPL